MQATKHVRCARLTLRIFPTARSALLTIRKSLGTHLLLLLLPQAALFLRLMAGRPVPPVVKLTILVRQALGLRDQGRLQGSGLPETGLQVQQYSAAGTEP